MSPIKPVFWGISCEYHPPKLTSLCPQSRMCSVLHMYIDPYIQAHWVGKWFRCLFVVMSLTDREELPPSSQRAVSCCQSSYSGDIQKYPIFHSGLLDSLLESNRCPAGSSETPRIRTPYTLLFSRPQRISADICSLSTFSLNINL